MFHPIPVTPKSYTRHLHWAKILAPPKHYILQNLNFPPFSRPYLDWLDWCLKMPEVVTKSRKTHAVKISAQSALRGQRHGHFTNAKFEFPALFSLSLLGGFTPSPPRQNPFLAIPTPPKSYTYLTIPATPKSLRRQNTIFYEIWTSRPFLGHTLNDWAGAWKCQKW